MKEIGPWCYDATPLVFKPNWFMDRSTADAEWGIESVSMLRISELHQGSHAGEVRLTVPGPEVASLVHNRNSDVSCTNKTVVSSKSPNIWAQTARVHSSFDTFFSRQTNFQHRVWLWPWQRMTTVCLVWHNWSGAFLIFCQWSMAPLLKVSHVGMLFFLYHFDTQREHWSYSGVAELTLHRQRKFEFKV